MKKPRYLWNKPMQPTEKLKQFRKKFEHPKKKPMQLMKKPMQPKKNPRHLRKKAM
jgi:hypothetical protein